MASFFSRLNPTPTFPEYTGPYKVGTVDLEVPVASLPQHSPGLAFQIPTVQCRIFYPCEVSSKHAKHPKWLPEPQHGYVGAYAKFLGASSTLAELIAYFPRLLYHITIPAYKNASLLEPPTGIKRWPVMIFSHGLGGTRTAYSHIVGSIASHGMIVVAPEHRDGSAPVSYIRHSTATGTIDSNAEKPPATVTSGRHAVPYTNLPHTPSKEVELARNEQLRIRLWEVSMIYETLLKLDTQGEIANLNAEQEHHRTALHDALRQFRGKMDVHTPGTISLAGHSFGAATMVQFVKSVFYRPTDANQRDPHFEAYSPLFKPAPSSKLIEQITPNTPLALLDLWAIPIRGESTRWLWDRPLPCYAPDGPGGTRLLAVLSEGFYKWNGNLKNTKRIMAEDPSNDDHKPTKPTAQIFYPKTSAHLSQSDFGVLFPWFSKKVFRAEEPERTLRLNVRAILQVLRNCGIPVADTSSKDMEQASDSEGVVSRSDKDKMGDWRILTTDGSVGGWVAVNPRVVEDEQESSDEEVDTAKAIQDVVIDGEIMNHEEREV